MPPKILLVDDDPLIHTLYKKHLEKAGYQTFTASDGSEAIAVASREHPSLIVMDIMMEGMNGLAALRQLKKGAETKDIPVIVITAHVSEHEAARQESVRSGASGFLCKPFSPAQLLTAAKRFVREA